MFYFVFHITPPFLINMFLINCIVSLCVYRWYLYLLKVLGALTCQLAPSVCKHHALWAVDGVRGFVHECLSARVNGVIALVPQLLIR